MLPESTHPSIAPWSELHLFGNSLTFPQSSWYQLLRKWVKPYINPSVCVCVFFPFSIYPQLFSASWWNIPENNLQPHTVDSALMLLTWKAFGMHYLSIKLLLKDEDLLLGNVLFTSMSLGIRYWAFITNHKSHLRWQSTEMSLLQLLLCAHLIQIRMNPECKSSYLS